MANYSQLKQSVKNVIKQNGQQEITGDALQSVLISMITNLGMGDLYAGLAIPSTNPGTPDSNVFYIAVQQGTYTNFGGLTVGANDGLTILAYNGTWTKTATGTAMKTDITTLQGTINSLSSTLQTVKSDLDTAEKSITTLQGRTIPLSVSFDLDKIDALTDSSGSTDIKAAFTPLSGIGVAPVAGNILRSGNVIKNSQEVTVIWSDYESKTAYYSFSYVIDNVLNIFQTDAKTFVRVAKTIVGGDVGAEIEDLQDRVSIGKAPVWITMTLEGEPHDPTKDNIGDIIFFEEGNYLKEVVRGATGGPTLGQTVDMETGRLYVYGGNLCKWEDGEFVPFYLDDINTLKSKARYEYSLSKILALTDTSEESAVEEAFTPTYDPEGSLAPRVPKAGDLLIDGNNTVVVSEGTQIFFSFTYQEEIISMRVYGGGSSFRFNVWKFPAGTVYDFNSIDTLTESSTADDIKKALTPKIGDGMRIPNSGDIMLIGIEENPDTVSVLYRYRNTFAYYHNRLLTTIEVEGEDDSLRVVKTISRNYVYDYNKVMALSNESTELDINEAFTPIGGSEPSTPMPGDLLVSTDDRNHLMFLTNTQTTASNAAINIKYIYGNILRNIAIRRNPRFSISVADIELDKEVKLEYKYNLQKILALSSSSSTEDIEEALTPTYAPDGNTAMRLPQSGDLLEATNGATSVVLKGLSKSFSFFYGDKRRDITLSGSAGNYKVAVVVTPLDVRVFDLDKLNALTNESTPEDIEDALGGNSPTTGDLLKGADESSWVIMSSSETFTYTFTYHTGGKLRTLTVSGGQGSQTIEVEEKEVEGVKDLAINAGATYDEASGTFTLNGVTGLTADDMCTIINAGAFRPVADVEFRQYALNRQIKTNIPYAQNWYTLFYMSICMRYMFASCVLLEAVRFSNASDGGSMTISATGSGESMFNECNKLVKVFEILDFSKVTDLTRAFTGCTSLTTIRIRNLGRHLYIGDSPNLSKESILYLIQNSAATSAITVTLHPTAYAMAIADTEIQNALQQKTFVSLAQAE